MSERSKLEGSKYTIPILEVLKEAKIQGDEPLDEALWKSEIRRKISEKYSESELSNPHRATIGRRITNMLEQNLVEETFFTEDYKKRRKQRENRNNIGDKGFRITEAGEEFLNEEYGGFLATIGASSFYDFILERHRKNCENCKEDKEECVKLSIDSLTGELTSYLNLDDDIVREANSHKKSAKEVREAAGLILVWVYLQRAIDIGWLTDGGIENNEVLKRLAIRDPRIAELVFSTHILPPEDMNDIIEGWGKSLKNILPVDQYLVMEIIGENDKEGQGVTKQVIENKLEEIRITYDSTKTIDLLVKKGYLEEIKEEGEKKYRLLLSG